MQIRVLISATLALGISFNAPESLAHPWKPTRGVEIMVGSAPGGGADLTGRLMQKLFQEKLITDVTSSVVNKTGGGSPEGPQPLPILLQDHGNPVEFRNVWLVER